MAKYPNITLTTSGLNMIAESQGSGQLIFTSIKLGDGTIASGEDIKALTGIKNPLLTANISSIDDNTSGQVSLVAVVNNANVNTGFFARELGVYAKVGMDGTEKLYGYTNAGNYADYMPDKNTPIDENKLKVTLIVSNAANVTAIIDSSIIYVTKKEFEEHTKRTDNPHNVTAAQVGAETPAGAQQKADAAKTAANQYSANLAADLTNQIATKANKTDIPTMASQVGAAPDGHGLGDFAALVTDFHSISTCGFYRGNNALNSPPAANTEWISAVVIAIASNAFTMTAQSYNTADIGKVWVCSCYGGTWSAWKQLTTTDQIPTTPAQVGAAPANYGLGTYNNNVADFNSATKGGFYSAIPGTTNAPTNSAASYWTIYVSAYDNGDCSQLAIPNDTGILWTRKQNNGIWSTWKNAITGDDSRLSDARLANGGNADTAIKAATSIFNVQGTTASPPSYRLEIPNVIANDFYMSSDGTVRLVDYTHAVYRPLRVGDLYSNDKQVATTDQTTYIVASGSGSNYYWRKWSNDDIEQYGWNLGPISGDSTQHVTFPVQFQHQVFYVGAIQTSSFRQDGAGEDGAGNWSLSGFDYVHNSDGGNTNYAYHAVGR